MMNDAELAAKSKEIKTKGMTEYIITTPLLAKKIDRDTAGRNGYLQYFDGSAPKDTSLGYAFYNPATGNVQWIEKEVWEFDMIENSLIVKALNDTAEVQEEIIESMGKEIEENKSHICENCEHYEKIHGSCFIMNIDINIMPPKFGCNKFEKEVK